MKRYFLLFIDFRRSLETLQIRNLSPKKSKILIESRDLNQIAVTLSYRSHSNIEISLNNRNTIGFDDDKYLGELIQGSREERIATCILSLYTKIHLVTEISTRY